MKKLIIFDLDGTLLYTLEDLTDSVNFALAKFNYPQHNKDVIKSFVGNGIEKLIERAIPQAKKDENFKECLEIFKRHYLKNMFNKTKPYKGIVETLKSLKQKGIKIAVLSNKFHTAVSKISNLYFESDIDFAQGTTEIIPKKPDIKGVQKILTTFNIKPDECLFVGDSEVDIKTAQNAKIKCISVSWGYKTKNFLERNGAEKIIETPKELLTLLN